MIELLRAGPLTTVQDLGRPGLAHLGVGRSGAADRPALRLANRLVGNLEGAAALEVTMGGLVLRLGAAHTIAVTGATCGVRVDGRARDFGLALSLPAGSVVELGPARWGVRAYLAVRGGVDAPVVLGSRATDLLARLGPSVLADGDVLRVGAGGLEIPGVEFPYLPPAVRTPILRVLPGPRDDWFVPAALSTLTADPYVVTADSDRVGVRLRGAPLVRSRAQELPSEGMVDGALQVPPDGQPVLFLADHPVTGGYPVIGVVHPDDLPWAAQARPGERLRFRLEPRVVLGD